MTIKQALISAVWIVAAAIAVSALGSIGADQCPLYGLG